MSLLACCLLQDAQEAQVDPFVEMELDDPVSEHNEVHTSPIIMNEASPRWNQKYDYIMISATSTLTATVYDKQGLFDGIFALPKVLLGKLSRHLLTRWSLFSVYKHAQMRVCQTLQSVCGHRCLD